MISAILVVLLVRMFKGNADSMNHGHSPHADLHFFIRFLPTLPSSTFVNSFSWPSRLRVSIVRSLHKEILLNDVPVKYDPKHTAVRFASTFLEGN
ncbi:unnamed protein product [Calypogeia fissa]